MFGLSRRERLERQVAVARLEKELRGLRPIEASTPGPVYPLSDPDLYAKLFLGLNVGMSADTALKHSTVWRCVSLIAGTISMLPLHLFRVDQGTGERSRDATSGLARMLAERPNIRVSPSMFWRALVSDMLLEGNGIVWIERKPSGEALALWQVPWRRTAVRIDTVSGEEGLVYGLTLDTGRYVVAHSDDVLHIPGSPVWDIFRAKPPLEVFANSVGIGISADSFAKAYFDNGMSSDGVIQYPGRLGQPQRDELRDYLRKTFGGGNRFSGPLVLDEAGTYTALPINAASAQLLDSRRYQATDIARIFGVPPHMIGEIDKATSFGKGIEEQTQSFVDYTLGPHLDAIEREVNWKLLGQRVKTAEFDRESLVRSDLKTRMEAIQIGIGGAQGPGVMTQNEGRAKLGLGPVEGGDRIVQWSDAKPIPSSGKGTPEKTSGPPDEGTTEPAPDAGVAPTRVRAKTNGAARA
jgi:HK97 family phage portal protein